MIWATTNICLSHWSINVVAVAWSQMILRTFGWNVEMSHFICHHFIDHVISGEFMEKQERAKR